MICANIIQVSSGIFWVCPPRGMKSITRAVRNRIRVSFVEFKAAKLCSLICVRESSTQTHFKNPPTQTKTKTQPSQTVSHSVSHIVSFSFSLSLLCLLMFRHLLQHNTATQDPLLHGQPHHTLRGHLLPVSVGLLPARRLRRKDCALH